MADGPGGVEVSASYTKGQRVRVTRSHAYRGRLGTITHVCTSTAHAVMVSLDGERTPLVFRTGGSFGAEVEPAGAAS